MPERSQHQMTPDEQRAEAQKVVDRIWAVIEYDQDGRWWMDNLKAIAIVRHALRDERRRTLEEAAKIGMKHCKGYDIAWWRETPKVDIYKQACLDVVQAIREQARRAGEDTHV